jgi:hypothetical protein
MVPGFFLPYLSPHFKEGSYAHIAEQCERAVPALGDRVYSVSFVRGGTFWIATVGKHLRGRKPMRRKQAGQWRDIFDSALVLAIFPGDPYIVVTCPGGNSCFRGTRIYTNPRGVQLFVMEG